MVEIREYPANPQLGLHAVIHDERSRLFRAVSLLDETKPRTKTWRRYPQAYDQGYTSECAIYSGKGVLNTMPLRGNIEPESRLRLETTPVYRLAQRLDSIPGEAYDGTTLLGAAKAFRQTELIDSYYWCFGVEDMIMALSWKGPVIIGVAWYDSMMTPDADGFLYVNARSRLGGGHAVEVMGVNVEKEYFVVVNSWGTGWGVNGRCFIRFEAMERLLADWGQAIVYVNT